MSERIVIIDNCDDCPNFDNEYYDYGWHYCMLLKRCIKQTKGRFIIPEDCTLPLKEEYYGK